MIIRDKNALVYDIEIFPNVFTLTLKNTETKEVTVIEVSKRKNNVELLYDIFSNPAYIFVSYNGIHYDNTIVNFLFDYKTAILSKDYLPICKNLHTLSSLIIESDDQSKWKKWKYGDNFAYLDLLTMLFSKKLRVGLKEMQVTMQYHNVQEYEGDFNQWLPESEIDKMLAYNLNDVESTEELLYRCEKQVRLRENIEKEFNVDVLSKDGMTIGMEILKVKYLEKSGKTWWEVKDLRSPCDIIDLNRIIFPFIKFENPVLVKLLNYLKSQKVGAGRKALEYHFLLDNIEISVGVGGIHTKNESEIIIPKDNETLRDSDVASLYPSLIVSYEIVPPHLGKEFLEIYGGVREDRLYAKRNGFKVKNETYKLALNGATGNYQNEYSWLYSPESVMKIRINGQLLILMLAEKILAAGGKLKQLNTDGILYLFPKNKTDKLDKILAEWEHTTKLTLETEEYEAFYQYAVNDYLAVNIGFNDVINKFKRGEPVFNKKGGEYKSINAIKKDFLKYKGLFIPEVTLGKGMQPLIIPKAINAYFTDNTPVEETVRASKDLNDFITYQKVDKKFSVEYKEKIISHINRYYVSSSGKAGYLYKCIVDENGKRTDYSNMLKASGVTIVNNFDEIKEFPKDINYVYYISEIKKIIDALTNKQLSLFD